MVVKNKKEYFEKTRHIKNDNKSKKFVLRGQKRKKMQDIMKEFYQIKRNLITSILFLIQHNCIFSRLSYTCTHTLTHIRVIIFGIHTSINV